MYRIDFQQLRFLDCDDNPHMRRILRTLLHSFGAREAYEAEDGATALEMYTTTSRFVITDLVDAIFDGLELAQIIRQPESKGNPYAKADHHADRSLRKTPRHGGARRRRHRISGKPISARGSTSAS